MFFNNFHAFHYGNHHWESLDKYFKSTQLSYCELSKTKKAD